MTILAQKQNMGIIGAMLPTGHIEWTWAGLNFIQRSAGLFEDVDYRIIAIAVTAPDLIDKPLAWFVFPDADAALFFGHTLGRPRCRREAAWLLNVGRLCWTPPGERIYAHPATNDENRRGV